MANWYSEQLTNNNYLSPIGFLFILEKARKVSFLCQKAEIPTFSISELQVPTPGFVQLASPDGQSTFANLTLDFIVDENLENYMQIHNWMRAIATPDDYEDRFNWIDDKVDIRTSQPRPNTLLTDGTLQVLNNNNQTNFEVRFRDMFPISLSSLPFDVSQSDNDYFTASVTFRYTVYDVLNVNTSTRR